MRRHQRFAKRDKKHQEIAKALARCGAIVFDSSGMGDGYPDLTVMFRRQVILLEVKASAKSPLTPAEQAFHDTWHGGPIHIVSSIDDAIQVLNGIE